ncbi:MAG: type II secretion system F family protein [Candidatus Omnitrophica bacterium]|nr:type II secretion system F family protein [Candidatus Omnitrophota bacterium]
MAKYFYVVRDQVGKKLTGLEEGSSQEEIVTRLQAKDLVVVTIVPEFKEDAVRLIKSEASYAGKPHFKHSRVSNEDLVIFCRQLATLLGAGVTILRSLDIICQQVSSRRLFYVLKSLQKHMESGLSLHEAMGKHPVVFSALWVNLTESGEASGNLATILNRLASYLERDAEFKRKIISALIYPAILFVAGTFALLFLTVKIIPTFADLFKNFNVQLPALTKGLINVSSFIRGNFIGISIILAVGFVFLTNYLKTKKGRMSFERFQLKLPVFGELFRGLAVEKFSAEMSTLIESGVPILYSLDIVEHSVDNLLVADIIRKIKEEVRDGKSFNETLRKSNFFEPIVIQMISIGEEIGELSQMFKKINLFYQSYVETFLNRFITLFEPIMLVFMGFVIGIMVIGMFLPIFQIANIGG